MFTELPLELQVSIIRHFSPADLGSFLKASNGQFDHLFKTFTDSNVSETASYFGTPGTLWNNTTQYGHINLIEIKEFLSLDLNLFLLKFCHRYNIVVIHLPELKEEDLIDFDTCEDKDPYRLNHFLKEILPNSCVLLRDLNKGFPLTLGDIDTSHLTIEDSVCVDIHGSQRSVQCTNIGDLVLQDVSQNMINDSDFSKTPNEVLILNTDFPCVLHNKNIAADMVLITKLHSLSNIRMKGKRLTILYGEEKLGLLENIFAENLKFLFVRFPNSTLFPSINNINTPTLEHAWFEQQDTTSPEQTGPDPSLSMNFEFLSSVRFLIVNAVTGPLLNCTSFSHLETLSLDLTHSLPVDFYLDLPVLDLLKISGSSMTHVPCLNAPNLSSYSLDLKFGSLRNKNLASNLPEVLMLYPRLTELKLSLFGLSPDVSDGIGQYLKSSGSYLTSLHVVGAWLDVLGDSSLNLPNLQSLTVKGSGDPDIDNRCMTLSFQGPSLKSIGVGSLILKEVRVSDFESLTSLSSTVSLSQLCLESVPKLETIRIMGTLALLQADYLEKLKKLTYSLNFGDEEKLVEQVGSMNPKVKRIIKRLH